MKAAFSYWQERIAPVFDTATALRVLEFENGRLSGEPLEETLTAEIPQRRTQRLLDLGVEVLVCGALSRCLHEQISAQGIQVLPFIAGELDRVVQAWLNGTLVSTDFAMPGCRAGVGRGNGRQRARWGRSGFTASACRCPHCGHRQTHQAGVPCVSQACPRCGTAMARE